MNDDKKKKDKKKLFHLVCKNIKKKEKLNNHGD